MNSISLIPVGKIILNETTPDRKPRVEHYIIPYYQRGYRWDEENVRALLEDIHAFMHSDEKKYCLQPIVVVPGNDSLGHSIWEVIDGQQRLITLNIIFKYLNRTKHNIIFERRDKSTIFLNELCAENYSDENPDFHFMSLAHSVIVKWFESKTKNDVSYIDEFNSTLTKKVELIWYQVEELKGTENSNKIEEKKIDIFNRLNVGKIPLTDAELIRALLLSKIKHGLGEREAILRQSEISAEWHRIEMELRNEAFWYFLNKSRLEDTSSAIEFIFKLIAEETERKYSTYLWFEKEIRSDDLETEKKNALGLWNKTKKCFGKLKHWYEDNYLYHHLGFKLCLEGNSLDIVRYIIKHAECSKSAFREWTINEVQRTMKGIDLDNISYEENYSQLKPVFLLHNIVISMGNNKEYCSRFPFDQYKKIENDDGWSIEHIHAQLSKEIKEENAIRKWLEDTYDSIKNMKELDMDENISTNETPLTIGEIKQKVEAMKNSEIINSSEFNELKLQIIQRFDSGFVHGLGNLALLASKHNSSLSNSIFAVKRNCILLMDKQQKFIPLATKNVFLKYYTLSDLQPYYWSKVDQENYVKDIKTKLKPYLTNIN